MPVIQSSVSSNVNEGHIVTFNVHLPFQAYLCSVLLVKLILQDELILFRDAIMPYIYI